VLHDLFAVPFDEIAPIVERSPTAAKKLASRARHRVHGSTTTLDTDHSRQRRVVDAFLAASRDGDIKALLAVLDPSAVRRADRAALPAGPSELRGAQAVAEETRGNWRRARFARVAQVDGAVGLVVAPRGRLVVAIGLTIKDDKIIEIDVIGDPCAFASSTWLSSPTDGPIHSIIARQAPSHPRTRAPGSSPKCGNRMVPTERRGRGCLGRLLKVVARRRAPGWCRVLRCVAALR
jgi:hypothetical protein